MRRMKVFGSTIGLFLAMALSAHADVQIGAFEAPPNCFPFGNCGYLGEYQQVYAGTAFVGTSNITSIAFASSVQSTDGPETLTVHLGLGSTAATPFDIAGPYADNKGIDFTEVFFG